ncbi:MAG: TatD family hydrolase [Paludibacteraceae bacterium]|nr:TatD family hydrolase [Paludibacteraceae bacterium]
MELIDTHTHIYEAESFGGDEQNIIARLTEVGVTHAILPNTSVNSMKEVLAFEAYDPTRFHPLMGLHPEDVDENWQANLSTILDAFDQHHYYGVGEVGIDLYWDDKYKTEQQKVFTAQIALATERDLPIIIHCRNGLEETLDCLKQFDKKKVRGIFHSFTGTIEEMERIKEAGDFKFGINGIVTFKKSVELQATIKTVDLDELVLETDSPYLTPVPFRGKRNETSYIKYVAQKIAEIKECTIEQVAEKTSSNAKEIFGI